MSNEITLAEAIKLQHTLTEKLKANRGEITRCYNKGNSKELNRLLAKKVSLSNDLVSIKAKIRKANVENNISRKIYELTEFKSIRETCEKIGYREYKKRIEKTIQNLEEDLKDLNNNVYIKLRDENYGK